MQILPICNFRFSIIRQSVAGASGRFWLSDSLSGALRAHRPRGGALGTL
jgi:hypothetical protein